MSESSAITAGAGGRPARRSRARAAPARAPRRGRGARRRCARAGPRARTPRPRAPRTTGRRARPADRPPRGRGAGLQHARDAAADERVAGRVEQRVDELSGDARRRPPQRAQHVGIAVVPGQQRDERAPRAGAAGSGLAPRSARRTAHGSRPRAAGAWPRRAERGRDAPGASDAGGAASGSSGTPAPSRPGRPRSSSIWRSSLSRSSMAGVGERVLRRRVDRLAALEPDAAVQRGSARASGRSRGAAPRESASAHEREQRPRRRTARARPASGSERTATARTSAAADQRADLVDADVDDRLDPPLLGLGHRRVEQLVGRAEERVRDRLVGAARERGRGEAAARPRRAASRSPVSSGRIASGARDPQLARARPRQRRPAAAGSRRPSRCGRATNARAARRAPRPKRACPGP